MKYDSCVTSFSELTSSSILLLSDFQGVERVKRQTLCRMVGVIIVGILTVAPIRAGWELVGRGNFPVGKDVTVKLWYKGDGSDTANPRAGALWLGTPDDNHILVPETLSYTGREASFPAFFRQDGDQSILVHDPARKETTTVTLSIKSDNQPWQPNLGLSGYDNLPLAFSNQVLTPTLTFKPGKGEMPPSAHIAVEDRLGRVVYSRFSNTFDLVAGNATVQVPAGGLYWVRLRLLNEPITSMPLSNIPAVDPIPYGVHMESAPKIDPATNDWMTTDVVIGSVVCLEHLPTTATVVAEDRLLLPVLATHSNEINRNAWPYMIKGVNPRELSAWDRQRLSNRLLSLQRFLGGAFASVPLDWSAVQRSPGSFQWMPIVEITTIYKRARVRPILVMAGKSAWADEVPTHSDDDLTAWIKLVHQISERYRALIWGMQCWSHPELDWQDAFTSSPTSYMHMAKATVESFGVRNGEAIPTPPVILGNAAGFNKKHMEDILSEDWGGVQIGYGFDLFPQKGNLSPEANGFEDVLSTAKMVRDAAYYSSATLWLNATGWAVGPDGVTRGDQANYLVRTYVRALAQGFYKVGWETLTDKVEYPWEGNARDRMGLLKKDMMLKPSGIAYNMLSFLLSGATPDGIEKQGDVIIFRFNLSLQNNKWPGRLYVAWTESTRQAQTIRLDMKQGGGVYALDYLGAEVSKKQLRKDKLNPLMGLYEIPVGHEPVYIWDAGQRGSSLPPSSEDEEDQEEVP